MAEVQVVLAVYRPDMAALERQVESVLAQQGCTVRLHLFADGPMPQLAEVEQLAARDQRILFTALPQNRGAAATFCEGLAAVLSLPGEGRHFAFCDQDDLWHADKLARSLARMQAEGADAVHGDVRVVDAGGGVIAPSAFALEGRVAAHDPLALFFRNNATGMTMVLSEALAARIAAHRALRPRLWLHDHFAAFLAATGKGLAFEPEPLADYVQHGGNAVGAGRRLWRWPVGDVFRADGAAARMRADAGLLLPALMADPGVSDSGRAAVERLHAMLCGHGLASLPATLAALARLPVVPRWLLAGIVWGRIAR